MIKCSIYTNTMFLESIFQATHIMHRTLLLSIFAVLIIGIAAREFDVTEVVTFRLFTVNNKYDQRNLGFDAKNLTASGFNMEKPTKIITHGFLNNGSGMSCIALRDAYLATHDVNVIIVDYEEIAMDLIWTQPEDKIRLVGEYVAQFIDFLIETGYSANKLHLHGHSLGAHVIGNAARHTTRGKIFRVTGLDPALMGRSSVRLNPDVAQFVDIIHTCRGIFGMLSSLGTVDFYPNGGLAIQPNCNTIGGIVCSHYEAVRFMARSIADPLRYPARLCSSQRNYENGRCNNNALAYMGITAAPPSRGDYYLVTQRET